MTPEHFQMVEQRLLNPDGIVAILFSAYKNLENI